MHDVTKRGLALAVAAGGLLITGAAPAVSAVSTHPEHPEYAGEKSQPAGDSSHRADIPVSAPQVEQYAGRHKALGRHAAAPHHTAASRAEGTLYEPAAAQHGTKAPHTAARHHAAASQHAAAPQHPGAAHHSAAQRLSALSPAASPVLDPGAGTAPGDPAQAQASALNSPGLLSGNTIEAPIDVPVNVCGVVATVIGGGNQAAGNSCVNGPGTAGGPSSSASAVAAGSPGALSGNVVQVPVSLPANICGDTVTAVGGHNSADDILCANQGGQTLSPAAAVASDSPGLVSGNVVQVPVTAPLNVCGITASVVGVHNTAAGNSCVNGGSPGMSAQPVGTGATGATSNSPGAVSGNVVQVPVEAPINVCGDSVSVVGVLNSAFDDHCANYIAGGASASGQAVGDGGLASGNVAQLPITIPAQVCGVAAVVGGYGNTAGGNSCSNGPVSPPPPAACSTPPPPPVVPEPPVSAVPPPPVIPNGPTPDGPTPPTVPALPVHLVPPPAPPEPSPYYAGPGQLAHTGADVLDYGAIGAGALVLGAGALMAARRKSGSAN